MSTCGLTCSLVGQNDQSYIVDMESFNTMERVWAPIPVLKQHFQIFILGRQEVDYQD